MKNLVQKACDMRQFAYAPHSHFHVGAALLTQDGTLIGGCNIESDSYGLTICAERNAIFTAYAQGHRKFQALSIAMDSNSTPCGACRQVIVELCGNIPVYITDLRGNITIFQSYDLLPNHFALTS